MGLVGSDVYFYYESSTRRGTHAMSLTTNDICIMSVHLLFNFISHHWWFMITHSWLSSEMSISHKSCPWHNLIAKYLFITIKLIMTIKAVSFGYIDGNFSLVCIIHSCCGVINLLKCHPYWCFNMHWSVPCLEDNAVGTLTHLSSSYWCCTRYNRLGFNWTLGGNDSDH